MTWLPPYKRNVNTVFQNYALFPHLTIFDNVAFGLRRRQVPDAEVKQRVSEMLALVELPGYERRKPGQISGGQAQRVALARALVNKPAVLLLDEPLGALDLKLRKQMQVELKRIQQEVGITFIYVTHDQEEAMTMSDRIAVMNRGRYEQLGDPETLYERPATRFVAGFLGVSNLLPATIGGPRRRLRRGQPGRRRGRPGAVGRGGREAGDPRSASGRRRSGSTADETAIPERLQPPRRDGSSMRRTSASRTSYIVEARRPANGSRSTSRTSSATSHGSLHAPGRGGPADLVAGPHLRRRASDGAGRRARVRQPRERRDRRGRKETTA